MSRVSTVPVARLVLRTGRSPVVRTATLSAALRSARQPVPDLLLRCQRAEVGRRSWRRARGHATGLRLRLDVRAHAPDDLARRRHGRVDRIDVAARDQVGRQRRLRPHDEIAIALGRRLRALRGRIELLAQRGRLCGRASRRPRATRARRRAGTPLRLRRSRRRAVAAPPPPARRRAVPAAPPAPPPSGAFPASSIFHLLSEPHDDAASVGESERRDPPSARTTSTACSGSAEHVECSLIEQTAELVKYAVQGKLTREQRGFETRAGSHAALGCATRTIPAPSAYSMKPARRSINAATSDAAVVPSVNRTSSSQRWVLHRLSSRDCGRVTRSALHERCCARQT